MLKLEYCNVSEAGDASEDQDGSGLLSTLSGVAKGVVAPGDVLDAATDAELAAHGCVLTTDLPSPRRRALNRSRRTHLNIVSQAAPVACVTQRW